MIRTKTFDIIKFGLFCALLFIVVIEFILGFNLGSVTSFEQLTNSVRLLTYLAVLDKVVIVVFLGLLAFPQEAK